jgi:hypothetical protein
MQRSLQSKVSRTQLRRSCAAASCSRIFGPAAREIAQERRASMAAQVADRLGARAPCVSVRACAPRLASWSCTRRLGGPRLHRLPVLGRPRRRAAGGGARHAYRPCALVDAFALPNSGLHVAPGRPRAPGRRPWPIAVGVDRRRDPAAVVVAYTPFHRPPHRDDLLAALWRTSSALARPRADPRRLLPVGAALRGGAGAGPAQLPRGRRSGEVRGRGTVPALIAALLARRAPAWAPPRRAPRSSTSSRPPPGTGSIWRARALPRPVVAGLGGGRGRSRSTAARCRWSLSAAARFAACTAAPTPTRRPASPRRQRGCSLGPPERVARALPRARRDPPGRARRAGQRARAALRPPAWRAVIASISASRSRTACAPTTSSRATSRP